MAIKRHGRFDNDESREWGVDWEGYYKTKEREKFIVDYINRNYSNFKNYDNCLIIIKNVYLRPDIVKQMNGYIKNTQNNIIVDTKQLLGYDDGDDGYGCYNFFLHEYGVESDSCNLNQRGYVNKKKKMKHPVPLFKSMDRIIEEPRNYVSHYYNGCFGDGPGCYRVQINGDYPSFYGPGEYMFEYNENENIIYNARMGDILKFPNGHNTQVDQHREIVNSIKENIVSKIYDDFESIIKAALNKEKVVIDFDGLVDE